MRKKLQQVTRISQLPIEIHLFSHHCSITGQYYMSIEKVMVDNRRKYVQILSKHPARVEFLKLL